MLSLQWSTIDLILWAPLVNDSCVFSRFCYHANNARAERAQVLRVFKDSVTAPAGVRADPDGHMMSPRGEPADGVEGSVYLHKHLHERPRAQCLLPPSVCVNDLSAALMAVNARHPDLRVL